MLCILNCGANCTKENDRQGLEGDKAKGDIPASC